MQGGRVLSASNGPRGKGREMTISVVIPIGDRAVYRACRASMQDSIGKMQDGLCSWELVEVFDDARRGVAWARNEGVRRATGDYVAWVDCDDVVTESWATAIAQGLLEANAGTPTDVLVFDARAEWLDGRPGYDLVYGRPAGDVPPDMFARDVIGATCAGGWLWNKVFRRELFAGREFVGNAFQDYRMLCDLLPDVRHVRYVPERLYVYRRSKTGISQYVNRAASYEALRGLIELSYMRKDAYAPIMRRGIAVQIADFCRHAGGEPVLRAFLRSQLCNVCLSREVSFRGKMKCAIEAFKFWRGGIR